jgi:hypothetical protein
MVNKRIIATIITELELRQNADKYMNDNPAKLYLKSLQ